MHVAYINSYMFWYRGAIIRELLQQRFKSNMPISSSSCHGVGPLVDPFRSHVSRSLFKVLPWFILPVGECCFITLGNLLWRILFTCCIQFLLYSSNLSRIGVIFNSFAIYVFVLLYVQVYSAVLLMYFISAADILLSSLALIVQVSLPYNKTGRADVLYNLIPDFLRVFCSHYLKYL
jgi:hypothetical protein